MSTARGMIIFTLYYTRDTFKFSFSTLLLSRIDPLSFYILVLVVSRNPLTFNQPKGRSIIVSFFFLFRYSAHKPGNLYRHNTVERIKWELLRPALCLLLFDLPL